MQFKRIILFGIIGLCLGFSLFLIDNSGFFDRWQKISNPSNEHLNLFSQETFPDNSQGVEFIKPCKQLSPELFILWNPPKNIADCVQRIDREADVYARSTFVMDKNDNIWMWQHSWYAYAEYSRRVFFPIFGLVIGMIVALIGNKRHKTMQKRLT